MRHEQHVRVILPLLAVRSDSYGARSGFVEVNAGTVLSTMDDFNQPGLIPVTSGSDELLVFARDLTERTEPIESYSGLA